jgi:hypothetical protein
MSRGLDVPGRFTNGFVTLVIVLMGTDGSLSRPHGKFVTYIVLIAYECLTSFQNCPIREKGKNTPNFEYDVEKDDSSHA